MKGYREAFYPRPRTPTPPRSPYSAAGGSPHTPIRNTFTTAVVEVNGSPDATDAFAGTAQPLTTSRDDGDDGHGPDMEELRAMEEMEAMMEDEPKAGVGAVEDEFGGLYD